jgi:CBS domain-containing protein
MTTVAKILQSKTSNTVQTIEPNATVLQALHRMTEHRVGALLVMQGDTVQGIVTERDFARKVEVQGRSASTTPVRDVMTTAVLFVKPTQTTEECMALMSKNRLRHLPVQDAGKLVGMISIGDLVQDIISEQQFIIEQLGQYIAGAPLAQ